MEITKETIEALLTEPTLTGSDIRVWLMLVDNVCSAGELAEKYDEANVSNISRYCRRLREAGWIEIVETKDRQIRYTARTKKAVLYND